VRLGVVGVDRVVLFRLATSERLERIVNAVPGGETQAWRAASRYVAGRSRDEALLATVDLLGHG
jgi:proline dehydrogenase